MIVLNVVPAVEACLFMGCGQRGCNQRGRRWMGFNEECHSEGVAPLQGVYRQETGTLAAVPTANAQL
jgi:hypothetical protein